MEEWAGAKAQHFVPPRKRIGTSQADQKAEFLAPAQGLLTYTHAGLAVIQGRKHYEEKFGVPMGERKPCIQKVVRPPRPPERVQSMKYIKPEYAPVPPRAEKAHIPPVLTVSGRPEFPIHTRTVRTVSGDRVRDFTSTEYDFHKTQMGRKQLVCDLRNGLPVSSQGDKAYNVAEYAPGFFREEGLFSRTSFRPRLPMHVKGAASSYGKLQSYEATGPARKKWSQRQKEETATEDQTAINSLLEW